MMKKFAKLMLMLMLGLLAVGLTGCGSEGDKQADNHLTVALWEYRLIGEYSDYIQSQVPEADIEWMVGKNDLDFYIYLQEQNSLPDIISNRRFSLLDAYPLREHLLDLSETELAASYHTIYLDKYKNENGTVNWLPAPGVFDGLIANRALFEAHNIPLPTDYDSFVAACLAFEEMGIRGYVTDYAYDYSCMETLQGFSIEALSSLEGKTWRRAYENKLAEGLDEVVWPGVFERMQDLIDKGLIKSEELAWEFKNVHEAFVAGKAAMIRGTGAIADECIQKDGMDVVALPYFGSSSEENWALTYPVFQAAVNKRVAEDAKKQELALKVMEAMLSEEAQRILNGNSGAQISYNKDITLPLAEEMQQMLPLIESNHIYIRVASNDFFQASMDVVPKMMSGEYGPEEAYAAFNAYLTRPVEASEESVTVFEETYSLLWDDEKGNQAASCVANTVRQALDVDVVVLPFYDTQCSIFAGEQTETTLVYPVQAYPIGAWQLSGAEFKTFLAELVANTHTLRQLPVLGGAVMTIKQDGEDFSLTDVTIDGQPIAPDAELTVAYADKSPSSAMRCVNKDQQGNILRGQILQTIWREYLLAGEAPLAPANYLKLQ